MTDYETRRGRAKIQDVREQRATATPFELLKSKNGELRTSGDGHYILEGYASTWEPYDCYGGVDAGGWIEQFDRRAFDATLRTNPDLQLLINHEGMPLARTISGTLELSTDKAGLKVRAFLDPDDPDVQALLPKMKPQANGRSNMDEMSFAFRVKDQAWNDNYTHRSITEVSLQKGDVSVVNYGMNPTTKASIMLPSAIEALAHMGDKEMAELRKLPRETLDSALRSILRAEGIPDDDAKMTGYMAKADEMSIDELDVALAKRYGIDPQVFKRGVMTLAEVRAMESDPKDPDKDPETGVDPDDEKDPKREPEKDGEDIFDREDEPVTVHTPYVADVAPERKDPEGQKVEDPKKKHPKHPKTPGVVHGYVGIHTPDETEDPEAQEEPDDQEPVAAGLFDPELVWVTEDGTDLRASDPKKPYGNVPYADPGYKDGQKRYPIDTEAHARAAWSYINQSKNQAGYTAEQVASIKSKIKAALKRFGVDVSDEKKSQIVSIELRGDELAPVFILGDGTELGVCDEVWAAHSSSHGRSQEGRGGSNPGKRMHSGFLGTQRLAIDGDQGEALEPSQGVEEINPDAQDDTTVDNASAATANDELVKDEYCTLCGETDHAEGACKGVDVGEGSPEDTGEAGMRTIGDQNPKDPKKKNPGSSDSGDGGNDPQGQEPDDDEDDKKSRSIAAEILATSEDDSLYHDVAERLSRKKDDDEDDPRKRNYTLTRALSELDEEQGPGLSLREAASAFLAEDRDYSEPQPEPEKQPEPQPEPEERAEPEPEQPKPPALSISDAFRELREGAPSLRVGGATRLVSEELQTPEAVERVINPPSPPAPEPEPERPPALRMDEAWAELRGGEDALNVERAEQQAVPEEIKTPEVVERLMQPPPEPEPEPQPEPVDVRSELQKFLDEDRKRYSLEEALQRAAELGAKEIARDNPTTHQIDAGWNAIDNAGKQYLSKDEGAA